VWRFGFTNSKSFRPIALAPCGTVEKRIGDPGSVDRVADSSTISMREPIMTMRRELSRTSKTAVEE